MRLLAFGVGLALLGETILPGQDLPAWVLQLSRVKRHARENFEHMPNYVCLETIDRFSKSAKGPFRKLDSLHLEVALVGGQELFAHPGADRFEDVDLSSLVSEGAIGVGDFSAPVQNLFVHDNGRVTGWAEETMAGRRVLRFDYEISEFLSAYKLNSQGVWVSLGLRGSYWADAETLDLLRIAESPFDIPGFMTIAGLTTTIDYAPARIGASTVVLPRSAEVLLRKRSGGQSRNVIGFSGCREYRSESVIHFDTPPETPPPPPPFASNRRPASVCDAGVDGPAGHGRLYADRTGINRTRVGGERRTDGAGTRVGEHSAGAGIRRTLLLNR